MVSRRALVVVATIVCLLLPTLLWGDNPANEKGSTAGARPDHQPQTRPVATRPSARREIEVRGKVIDHADNPVVGAELCLVGPVYPEFVLFGREEYASPRVRTDEAGRFTLEGDRSRANAVAVLSPTLLTRMLPDDDRALIIRLPESATLTIHFDIPQGENEATFVLHRTGWTYGMKGVCLDTVIKARNGGPATVSRLPVGKYSFRRVGPTLRLTSARNVMSSLNWERRAITLDPGQTVAIDITRKQGQPLTGKLVFPEDARVEYANVLIEDAAAEGLSLKEVAAGGVPTLDIQMCRPNGEFRTELIPPGDYLITAEAYAPQPKYDRLMGMREPQGPAYMGTAKVTVPKTGKPEPIRIKMASSDYREVLFPPEPSAR
jgi:hypothetical protein